MVVVKSLAKDVVGMPAAHRMMIKDRRPGLRVLDAAAVEVYSAHVAADLAELSSQLYCVVLSQLS